MRDNGLSPKRKQKFKKTTDSKHNKAVTSNLLDQDFSAQAPNEKWAGDISYIWTAQGWLYLAVILDLFSRRVVGWAAGPRMTSDLPLRALNRAIALRRPSPGAIHHSDRGSQYCSDVYQARLGELGFLVSMSGKGNCYDNAAVETFFKTIKSELIWRTVFMSRNQAEIAIAGYIDGFYNPVRRHSTLGFISPVKFETNALQPA
jgi:putative transposase